MSGKPYKILAAGSGLAVAGTGLILAMVDSANKAVGYVVGVGSANTNVALSSAHTLLPYWGPLGLAAIGLGAVSFAVIKYKHGRRQ